MAEGPRSLGSNTWHIARAVQCPAVVCDTTKLLTGFINGQEIVFAYMTFQPNLYLLADMVV